MKYANAFNIEANGKNYRRDNTTKIDENGNSVQA